MSEYSALFILMILLIFSATLLMIMRMHRRKPIVKGVYDETPEMPDREIIEYSREEAYRTSHDALIVQRDSESEADEKLAKLEALRAEGKISEDAYERLRKELSSHT